MNQVKQCFLGWLLMSSSETMVRLRSSALDLHKGERRNSQRRDSRTNVEWAERVQVPAGGRGEEFLLTTRSWLSRLQKGAACQMAAFSPTVAEHTPVLVTILVAETPNKTSGGGAFMLDSQLF